MGRCWKFGDNISTDHIIAGKYLITSEEKVLAPHCLEDTRPEFPKDVKPGDFVVGGENFGCGSSREHAPIALKGCKIKGIIASSFARIFFRNAINIGLPIFESKEAAKEIQEGDEVEVDMQAGKIINSTNGKSYNFEPFPKEILEIIEAGGLMQFVKKKMGKQ